MILDTNIISELMKLKPSARVFDWVSAQPRRALFTTAVNQAEILFGIALLPKGKRRNELAKSAQIMFAEDFAGRLLSFDPSAARHFAEIAVARRKSGRPISHADAQIAAIARAQGLVLVTRNVEDFADCGVVLTNPWKD